MKKCKKILAIILSAILLLAVVPTSVFAEEVTVVDISASDIEVIENVDGYWEDGYYDPEDNWVEEQWFRYDYEPQNITVTYSDNSTEEYETLYDFNVEAYYSDEQTCDNPWQVGDSHTVYICFPWDATGFPVCTVTVVENPIESITVDDISYIVGTNGYWNNYEIWNEETEEYEWVEWYEYDVWPESVIVELKNGDVLEGFPYEVAEQLNCDYNYHCGSDQAYDNQWGIGSHTAYFELLGFETEFTVEITESPIESISVEDTSCIVGTNGYWTKDEIWNEETEEYEWVEWYEYYADPEYITVEFKDGDYFEGNFWEVIDELRDKPGFYYAYGDDQSYENQWGIGTHTATFEFMGAKAEYNVEITENPIESITVDDISHVVGTNMSWTEDEIWNEETEEYEWVEWRKYDVEPEYITIELKDGETVEGDIWDVTEALDYHDYSYDSDQSYDNQWGIGTHTATFEFMGVKAEYNVEITESPVKSITVEDVSHIEGTNGGWNGIDIFNEETEEYDYFEWYEYNLRPDYLTVELEDGEIVEGSYWEVCDELGCEGDYDSDQSYYNQWGVGTHTATFEFMGVKAEYNVIITETPVKSIEIEDLEIIEGSNGYYANEGYYEIYYDDLKGTITFKDGSTYPANRELIIDEEWYELSVYENGQYDEEWEVGNTYEATASILGVSTTFNVTVTPTPIKSFTLKDIVLYQGIDSEEWDGNEEYDFDIQLSQVLLKDGTKGKIEDNELVYNGEYYWVYSDEWEMQYEEPWEVGKTYKVTAYLLGKEATFNVTIKANPIKELQLIKKPLNTEILDRGSLNLKGAVIRIKYTDGTYEDVSIDHDFTSGYRKSVTAQKIGRTGEIYMIFDANGEDGGIYNDIYLFGACCSIPVTPKELSIESISIKETADKSLIITAKNSDNTTFDMKVLDIAYSWYMDEGEYYACILTDKGTFNACIYADEDSFSLKLLDYYDEEIAASNVIGASDWFKANHYVNEHPLIWMSYFNDVEDYNGVVTSKNIDQVIQLAVRLSDIEIRSDYEVISGDEIRDVVAEFFAIDDIDLTLSKNYNEEKDEYLWIDMIRGGGELMKERPNDISYSNGIWNVTIYPNLDNKSFNFKFNDDLQILSYSIKSSIAELRTENGVTYYYENGVKSTKTGIVELDGKQIYINKGKFTGASGLVTVDGKKMYINKGYFTGSSGLVTISGKKAYINKGYFTGASGLVTINGKKTYINKGYFTGSSGLVTIGGKKMYINKGYFTGSSGLVTVSGKKMYISKGYFLGKSGLVTISGKKAYINKGYFTGATGIVTINGKKHYINKGYFTGASGKVKVGGKTYTVVKGIVK